MPKIKNGRTVIDIEHVEYDGNGGYWLKDTEGIVWHILRTPYKEIPITNFNPKE